MLTVGLAAVALFGLCLIVSAMGHSNGGEFETPKRNYNTRV